MFPSPEQLALQKTFRQKAMKGELTLSEIKDAFEKHYIDTHGLSGNTALFFAVAKSTQQPFSADQMQKKYKEAIILVKFGAGLDKKNREGKTIFDYFNLTDLNERKIIHKLIVAAAKHQLFKKGIKIRSVNDFHNMTEFSRYSESVKTALNQLVAFCVEAIMNATSKQLKTSTVDDLKASASIYQDAFAEVLKEYNTNHKLECHTIQKEETISYETEEGDTLCHQLIKTREFNTLLRYMDACEEKTNFAHSLLLRFNSRGRHPLVYLNPDNPEDASFCVAVIKKTIINHFRGKRYNMTEKEGAEKVIFPYFNRSILDSLVLPEMKRFYPEGWKNKIEPFCLQGLDGAMRVLSPNHYKGMHDDPTATRRDFKAGGA